jgi:septum formation protein
MWIVLASESPRRRKLLSELGLVFDVVPSHSDEGSVKDGDPARLVQRIAELKARTVDGNVREDSLIVAADTMVLFEGSMLGKPKDREDAARMLGMLSGKEHLVYTGVFVLNKKTGRHSSDFQMTRVRFRQLTSTDIERCLSVESTMTGAGAYVPETWPILFESIDGSYTNVLGLPMEKLIPMLRENGVQI